MIGSEARDGRRRSVARSISGVALLRSILGVALLRSILGVALLGLVAPVLLSGCGGKKDEIARDEQAAPPSDPLQRMAVRIDSLFLAAHSASAPDSVRAMAYLEIEDLLRGVAKRKPQEESWSFSAYRDAVGEYGLAIRFETLAEGKEPFLVLAHDPRSLDVAPRAWLFYPQTASSVRVPSEPFLQEFSPRAWKEGDDALLAVLGWERAHSGLQPKGWLFRLPADPTLDVWKERELPPVASQFLSQGGAEKVRWLPETGAAPQILVEGAARANPLFDECGACPHLEADLVYGIALEQFVPQRETLRRTPYASFVAFVEAMVAGDASTARNYASDPLVVEVAQQYGFHRPPARGRWRAAPGVTATQLDQTYFRGEQGVFRVLLTIRDSSFVVSSITPTEFLID